MAATGKTPILLYGSTTATNTPSAGNLTNSSDGCEIAINVADKNLFFKDATNTVNTVPVRQSSASSDGWLSSTDWSTFNSKQPAGTYVTSVTGTAPVVSSGGTTPAISMAAANGSTNGYLTSTDWTTFNSKQPAGSYALTTGNLSQFASTTSAQLAGVISDETGTGNLVFSAAPTLTGIVKIQRIQSTYDGSSGAPVWDLRNSNGAQWEWYSPTSDNSLKLDVWVPGQRDNVFSIQNVAGSHNITVSTGNLVIGTSGKGIDFSATAGTGTSELLADYEEGTWTPTVASAAGSITSYTSSGTYTKVGRLVTLTFKFTITNNGTGSSSILVSNLPFTAAENTAGVATEYNAAGFLANAYLSSSTQIRILTYAWGYPGGANYSLYGSIAYPV